MTNRRLLQKLSHSLFDSNEEREAFEQALLEPTPPRSAVLWLKEKPHNFDLHLETPYPWQPHFVDIASPGERPGANPLHDEGSFYVLDSSSVFAASVLCEIEHESVDVITDLCASPGGKAVFAYKLFSPNYLLCNEVIGKRTAALISNIKRLNLQNTFVSSSDVKYLAPLGHAFDLVIVDAPCSGQSLLAKGMKSPGCLHPASINKNANRQKRILANAASMVAPGGHLAYMTCTYSKAENEMVLEWFMKKCAGFTPVRVNRLLPYFSPYTKYPCYRLFPQNREGAGAFTALLQREGSGEKRAFSKQDIRLVWP